MKLQEKLESIEKILLNPQPVLALEEPDFLTLVETSDFTHLAIPTIYGLVRDAKIPVYKRGRRLYFSKAELSDWIKAGRKKTVQELNDDAVSFLANKKWGSN